MDLGNIRIINLLRFTFHRSFIRELFSTWLASFMSRWISRNRRRYERPQLDISSYYELCNWNCNDMILKMFGWRRLVRIYLPPFPFSFLFSFLHFCPWLASILSLRVARRDSIVSLRCSFVIGTMKRWACKQLGPKLIYERAIVLIVRFPSLASFA